METFDVGEIFEHLGAKRGLFGADAILRRLSRSIVVACHLERAARAPLP